MVKKARRREPLLSKEEITLGVAGGLILGLIGACMITLLLHGVGWL